jgi:hypothetical protein
VSGCVEHARWPTRVIGDCNRGPARKRSGHEADHAFARGFLEAVA